MIANKRLLVIDGDARGSVHTSPASPMNYSSTRKWFDLYQSAMVELQHSATAGHLMEVRFEIARSIELLKEISDLNENEYKAINGAVTALRGLDAEGAEEPVVTIVMASLRSLAPLMERLKPDTSE